MAPSFGQNGVSDVSGQASKRIRFSRERPGAAFGVHGEATPNQLKEKPRHALHASEAL
jgi:hypothetical protein